MYQIVVQAAAYTTHQEKFWLSQEPRQMLHTPAVIEYQRALADQEFSRKDCNDSIIPRRLELRIIRVRKVPDSESPYSWGVESLTLPTSTAKITSAPMSFMVATYNQHLRIREIP